jgi:hypothetical protein
MALDFTVNRCARNECNRVARWTRRDEDDRDEWWCKDHAPGGTVHVMAPLPPEPEPEKEREGILIGSTSLRIRYKD